jgi:hypothetical protein
MILTSFYFSSLCSLPLVLFDLSQPSKTNQLKLMDLTIIQMISRMYDISNDISNVQMISRIYIYISNDISTGIERNSILSCLMSQITLSKNQAAPNPALSWPILILVNAPMSSLSTCQHDLQCD